MLHWGFHVCFDWTSDTVRTEKFEARASHKACT